VRVTFMRRIAPSQERQEIGSSSGAKGSGDLANGLGLGDAGGEGRAPFRENGSEGVRAACRSEAPLRG